MNSVDASPQIFSSTPPPTSYHYLVLNSWLLELASVYFILGNANV